MAPKVTSSGNRSGRKPSKPPVVTSSKGRGNRSNVSTARVSTGSNGKPQSGGARVTNSSQRTTTGSSRTTGGSRPALPPGNRGGAITRSPGGAMTTSNGGGGGQRQMTGQPAPQRLPGGSGGADSVRGSGVRTGQPGAARPALPASATRAVAGAAKGAGALRNGLIGAVGLAGADYIGTKAGNAIGNFLRENTNKPKDDRRSNQRGGRSTRAADKPARPTQLSSQGIRVSDKGNKRDYVSAPTGSQEYNDYRSKQIEAEKARLKNVGNAPARSTSSSTPSRSSSSPVRMPSSVTRSSAPKAPAAPAKPTERRVSASTANREAGNYGTSKTNNPLMKDFVGRMKDREDKAQSSAAKNLTSKFNTESNFSAEKVDGSNVNTKAKLNSTTSEYDKKKRRYGG